jgi:ribosomal protein S18 acetylase RimI-like enzyme
MEALRNRPALHVVLAVDERNVPARRLYASFGFVETEVNDVFLFLF